MIAVKQDPGALSVSSHSQLFLFSLVAQMNQSFKLLSPALKTQVRSADLEPKRDVHNFRV